MERIFRHKDGSLFIKLDSPCIKIILPLQIVSPSKLNSGIDLKWFGASISNGDIDELITKNMAPN